MIKVCDAIMGSGKSSAAITLMNENPDGKYIYITPYIEEAKRIRDACPKLRLVEPRKTSAHHGSKVLHTIDLIRQGHNVTTTHQAFRYYPPELLDLIREKEYTLIIDESVNVFYDIDVHPDDMQLILDAGRASIDETGKITLVNGEYHGAMFQNLFSVLRTRDIVRLKGQNGREDYYCWMLTPEMFRAAPTTYVLTYQFEGQDMSCLFRLYGLEYEKIGVKRCDDGLYRFTDGPSDMPEYVSRLPEMIHIVENDKLNQIGDDVSALSMNWYKKDGNDVAQLKNNMYNYFRHVVDGADYEDRMWGVYEAAKSKLKGKGYTNGFVIWNERAKNAYRNKRALAYCANIYMNVGHKLYFESNGIDVDEDLYALSIMIQWIWRSSIRDGKEIDIYIPSSRMRGLLKRWIAEVSEGVKC